MNNLHAHIEMQHRDCDGTTSESHVMTLKDAERTSDFGEIEFHDRVVASVVTSYSIGGGEGTLTVRRMNDGKVRLSWHEQTDEGYRAREATFCDSPCLLDERTYRDHAAEAAGY